MKAGTTMVTRNTAWAEGTPCWADLETASVDKAKAFYGALLGWSFTDGPEETMGYTMADKDGHKVAGIGPKQDEGHPSAWTTYLAADDADATAAKIKDAGGQIVLEPMDVLEFGRMAIAVDTAGVVFGIWQSGTTTGFELANEPGSVTWNENMSRDFEAAKKFYADAFGATYTDMSSADMEYATIEIGGETVGGIGTAPEGVPAEVPGFWQTYFSVDDTDAAVAKATELGGSLMAPAFDTPFGRIALLTDDQGAAFAVIKNATPA